MSLLDSMESHDLGPKDVPMSTWVYIMRQHRRSLDQSETSGTSFAPYSDYEEYWASNQIKTCLSCESKLPPVKLYQSLAFPLSKPFWRTVCPSCNWMSKPIE